MAVEGTMTNMTTGELPAQPTPQEVLAEAPAAETPAPAPAPEPEKPREQNSSRFAALARKEQEVFRKQQAIRQQQAELARQAEEIRAFNSMRQQALQNPLEALKSLGLTYEQITDYVLNDNKPTPSLEVQSVRQEIEALKQQQQLERQRILEEQRQMQTQQQQEIIENFREEVNEYVAQHADTYELTSLYGGANLVFQVIEEHYTQQLNDGIGAPKVMSIPEAAKLVEEHYEDLARKAQATKKFAATQQKVASPQTPQTAQAPRIGPTLSNDLNASVAANPQRPRSDADRIAAALARLEGR